MSLLFFLLVLSILVLGHELGHYVAARLMGVKAEEFGYGFPPRAVGFVKKAGKWIRVKAKDRGTYTGTIWSLNWLPLGGFVRLKGEQGEDAHASDSFLSKGPLARLFILSAGVMMNWLIAIIIFTIGFAVGIPAQTENLPRGAQVQDPKIQITEVFAGSAGDRASLKPGDVILAINHTATADTDVARTLLQASAPTSEILLTVEHKHETRTVTIQPTYIEQLKRPGIGITMMNTGIVRLPLHQAVVQGFVTTGHVTWMILKSFGMLIQDLFVQHRVSADVSGPIGIAVMTGKMVEQGFWPLAQFAALLSINLAIVNFLPIPALDGGRALFVGIEALRRRRSNPKLEALFHQIGFVALLVLVGFVTIHDLQTYGGAMWLGVRQFIGL